MQSLQNDARENVLLLPEVHCEKVRFGSWLQNMLGFDRRDWSLYPVPCFGLLKATKAPWLAFGKDCCFG